MTTIIVLLSVILVLLLCMGLGALLLFLFIIRDTVLLPQINTKTLQILYQLMNSIRINDMLMASQDKQKVVFQTADGKYSASSMEELMSMMMSDPESPLSEAEREAIQNFFERMSGDDEGDMDDEQDDWNK